MSGRWSDWVPWEGGDCPLMPGAYSEIMFSSNQTMTTDNPEKLKWYKNSAMIYPIAAYRYWIEDDKEQPAKQTRYLDRQGDDWIDEFARTATVDEFRGAMKFTIGKYLRRIGKKDDIPQELGKIRDYAERWKEYESNL